MLQRAITMVAIGWDFAIMHQAKTNSEATATLTLCTATTKYPDRPLERVLRRFNVQPTDASMQLKVL